VSGSEVSGTSSWHLELGNEVPGTASG